MVAVTVAYFSLALLVAIWVYAKHSQNWLLAMIVVNSSIHILLWIQEKILQGKSYIAPRFAPHFWSGHGTTMPVWTTPATGRISFKLPSFSLTCYWMVSMWINDHEHHYEARCCWYHPCPQRSVRWCYVQLQEHFQNLCVAWWENYKIVAEFLCAVGWNVHLNHHCWKTLNIYVNINI